MMATQTASNQLYNLRDCILQVLLVRQMNWTEDRQQEAGQPTIDDAFPELIDVVRRHLVWVSQNFGDLHWDGYFIHSEIGIRRNDCPACEIDTLATQVPPEPSLLSLQPLHKAPTQQEVVLIFVSEAELNCKSMPHL